MARRSDLKTITNSLVTSKQLLVFQQSTAPSSRTDILIFRTSILTQTAGILLRLPQEVIATSIIILHRFLILDASSTTIDQSNFSVDSPLSQASAASVYLSSKQSFYPLSPRSIINVYALLTSPTSSPLPFINPSANQLLTTTTNPDPQTYYVSEGIYQIRLATLFKCEHTILATIAFTTTVVLPYNLALTYLQALSAASPNLSERVISHLNSALLSPQFLYLTHQPNALAVAAIYLAAREEGVSLTDDEVPWWEVFDVGREELGFLVLSLASIGSFVEAMKSEQHVQG